MPKGQYDRSRFQARKPEPPFQPSEENSEKSVIGDATGVVVSNKYERRPISEAPKNGETVLLFNAEIRHGVHGKWRTSRRYISGASGGRWVQNDFWACPITNKPLGMGWTEWEAL